MAKTAKKKKKCLKKTLDENSDEGNSDADESEHHEAMLSKMNPEEVKELIGELNELAEEGQERIREEEGK